MEIMAKKKSRTDDIIIRIPRPAVSKTWVIKSPPPDPKAKEKMIAFLKDLLRKLGEDV